MSIKIAVPFSDNNSEPISIWTKFATMQDWINCPFQKEGVLIWIQQENQHYVLDKNGDRRVAGGADLIIKLVTSADIDAMNADPSLIEPGVRYVVEKDSDDLVEGTVTSVDGVEPDDQGNVPLTEFVTQSTLDNLNANPALIKPGVRYMVTDPDIPTGKGISGGSGSGIHEMLPVSPHLWPTNGTEINLGDGTFGIRRIGAVNTSANLKTFSDIGHIDDPSATIIAYGGSWSWGTFSGDKMAVCGYSRSGPPTGVNQEEWWSDIEQSGSTPVQWKLITLSPTVRVNAPFDVWIRYTK
jgi:hypothetical protein